LDVRITQLSVRVFLGVGVVTVLAACAGTSQRAGVRAASVERCAPGSVRAVAPEAAVVTAPVTAFRAPGRGRIEHFGLLNVNRFPTVFGVLGERVDARCAATWLHVQLPIRPNGATGWVRADHVDRVAVHARIVVDLSRRTLLLYRGSQLLVRSAVAVGSAATPTPRGRYYVNQRLVPSEPGGPFGPGAIGISAFSPVLTGWAQGGPVAIHGTNEPWSIGHAVSNGCVRLPNATLSRLFRVAVAGTPVIIRA
jgi:lipoprotein-anchoring transpeptidase ErfK/SrfK